MNPDEGRTNPDEGHMNPDEGHEVFILACLRAAHGEDKIPVIAVEYVVYHSAVQFHIH